jgi:hypothetical protein
MENWCGMVLPFHKETLCDLGRVVARLRKSTFHGLSYADFLEALEAWTDNTVPNKIVLLFVMAEIAAEPVQERAARLYHEHPVLKLAWHSYCRHLHAWPRTHGSR